MGEAVRIPIPSRNKHEQDVFWWDCVPWCWGHNLRSEISRRIVEVVSPMHWAGKLGSGRIASCAETVGVRAQALSRRVQSVSKSGVQLRFVQSSG